MLWEKEGKKQQKPGALPLFVAAHILHCDAMRLVGWLAVEKCMGCLRGGCHNKCNTAHPTLCTLQG